MHRARTRLAVALCALLGVGGLAWALARARDASQAAGPPARSGGPAAGAALTDEMLVPLSGSDPIQVVSASQFNRFHLATRGPPTGGPPAVAPGSEAGRLLAQAQGHHDAKRYRSAASDYRECAARARAEGLGALERHALEWALHLDLLLDEHGAMLDVLDVLERLHALALERREALAAATLRADLGRVHGMLANYEHALDHLDGAASAFHKLGRHHERARVLASMGLVYMRRSEYGAALDELERARALTGEDPAHQGNRARLLGLLGNVYENLGDMERAKGLYESALRLHGREDSVDAAEVLGNLGSVHLHLGDSEEASRTFEEARSIFERLQDSRGTATALFNLGRVRKLQGGYRTALDLYRRALDLQERDSPEAARSLCALAETYLAMGRPDDALAELRDAVENVTDSAAPTVRVELLVLQALVSLRQDRPQRAVEEIRRALDLLTEMSAGLADEHVVGVREHRSWVFDIGLAVALKAGRVDLAAEFLEQGRAGALLEGLGGRGARRGVPAALVEAETRAAHRLATANRLYQNARAERRMKALREADRELQAARTAHRTVEQRIQREAKRVASVFHPVPDSLTDIRSALREGEVLVLYALLPFQAHALVIDADAARVVWLGNTESIRDACEALRVDSPDPTEGTEAAVRARLRALARMVIQPLALEGDVERLLISPDGPLCYVPFPLLFEDAPVQVACLPSGTTLRLLSEERGLAGRDALAVGDPTYRIEHQGHSLQVYADGVPLEPLPATRREVNAITGPGDMRLLGSYATVRQLAEVAASRPRWRVIHLACHGLIDPRIPTLSSLALTPEPGDDGFLTALEVYGMHLPAELVVLSGCNTGRGRFIKGEGLVGLMRAFMCAGAPRVVVSLWKVDDDATQALMTRFHQLWRHEGHPTAQALQQAQREIARQDRWSHPRYWGAWVLWGLSD